MKKVAFISMILLCAAPYSAAQNNHSSFQEFRKGILNEYSNFRKTILDHYADFLNGEWHEYESLNGEKRDRTPKPSEAPSVKTPESPAATKPEQRPLSPTPVAAIPATAKPEATPAKSDGKSNSFPFTFYELPVDLPAVEYNISYKLTSTSAYATQWTALDKSKMADTLIPAIVKRANTYGLNDYLTYKFIESYVLAKFPDTDDTSRVSVIHFLLTHLGYDARIAVTTTGIPILLLPFEQTIYARNYMMMQDGKYYIFAPEGFDANRLQNERVLTCQLPADADKGKHFDLRLGELKIPYSPQSFDLSHGALHLTGEVNANLMPILYRYPQMPVGDYAQSNVQPGLRQQLVEQIKTQLSGMKSDDAVAELLSFTQSVFDYATDEDYHGFEKPYFLEETLFYPKNDCEDRAIFYSWLVWNALGHKSQLISFPGHEAATVLLDHKVDGTGYEYNGKTYYISDPTYIGSTTGMVMPIYATQSPHIDYTYGE